MVSEAFVKIYFFFLLFNVAAFMIQATIDQAHLHGGQKQDAGLAFTTQHINDTGTRFINGTSIQNDTDTLVGQIYNPLNETGDPGDIVNENSILNILSLDNAVRFIDGGFILDGFDNFGNSIGLDYPNLECLDNAVRFIDGGFILDGFDNFGNSIGLDFPDEIKIGFAVVIGFLTFFWLLYVFLGRST